MMIDFEAAKFWLDVAWKVGTVLGLIWLAVGQRSKANSAVLATHETRFAEMEKALIAVRAGLESMNYHDEIRGLHGRISNVNDTVGGVREDLSALRAELRGLAGGVKRLEDYHLNRGATQ